MAAWITHLRVADLLIEKYKIPSERDFVIGSIAPDSGIPDPNSNGYIPPRRLLHRTSEDGKTIFYGDFAREYIKKDLDGDALSFFAGYYAHLATDDVWARRVYLPTRRKYIKQVEEYGNAFRARIKRSWENLDRLYLTKNEVKSLDILKNTDRVHSCHLGYITPEMLNKKLRDIPAFYDDLTIQFDEEYVFLTENELDGIIGYCVDLISGSDVFDMFEKK